MLSILIPTYNYDVRQTVNDLYRQAHIDIKDFEIVVYDDGSTDEQTKSQNESYCSKLENVRYKNLDANIGRSRIRNLMAKEASGDWLLFLDCDSGIVNDAFLKTYIQNAHNCDVICGGRIYNSLYKTEKQYILHTKTGINREDLQSVKRRPAFMTCNFLIRKEVFSLVRFNETICGYGHEDTLFGIDLQQNNFVIKYINNPVKHLDLKDTDRFLNDVEQSVKNLSILYHNPEYQTQIREVRLVKTYEKIKRLHLNKVFSLCINILKPLIKKQLHSSKPILPLLDLYKLSVFK